MEKYKHEQQKTVFPGTFAKPKDENIGTFLEKLSKVPSKAVVLHLYSEHCNSFVSNYKPPERAKFPNSLRNLHSKNILSRNENKLNLIVNEKFENLKLPMTDIDYVERLTKRQAQCNKWHQVRAGRIVASRVYDVLHTNRNLVSLIRNIWKLSSVCETKIPSLKWGIDNERNVILRYVEFKTYQGYKTFKPQSVGCASTKKILFGGHHLTELLNVHATKKRA